MRTRLPSCAITLFFCCLSLAAISSSARAGTTWGGLGFDSAYAVTVDAQGATYIAGETDSLKFGGAERRASRDLFVAKLDASASTLQYLVYLGGSGTDTARSIAVDSSGNVYIAGTTNSTDFPTSSGAYSRTNAGLEDVFIVKLNAAGAIVYSTLLGSSGPDQASGIAIDSTGNAYVTGQTSGAFPTTSAARQRTLKGTADCFVAKVNGTGTGLAYSTLLGGNGLDSCRGIAVDSSGNAYLAGYTTSSDFPLQGPVQGALKGTSDAFVAKLSGDGSALLYSTYLGGSGFDEANAIAIDPSGSAFIAGDTTSWDFSTTTGLVAKGDFDAFVIKLTQSGGAVTFSTLVGGAGMDVATGVALDGSGRVTISGSTNSTDLFLRLPVQSALAGSFDGFAAVLDAYGSVVFCSYLGGAADDRGYGVAATSAAIYLTGSTQSTDFSGATAGSVTQGNSDIFLVRVPGGWPDPPINISVTPKTASLYPDQTQQFIASGLAPNQTPLWSINPNVGSISSAGFYTAPPFVSAVQTVTVTARFASASSTATVTLLPLSAQFLRIDTTTQGTWKSVYGSQGYAIVNHAQNYPAGVTVTVSGNGSYTWTGTTTETRALQQVSSSQRIASVWYAPTSMTADLTFTDGKMHQLAVYCLDWDNAGRTQTLDILDSSGAVLDSRQVSNFGGGAWTIWNLYGHIQLRVTRTGPLNAVISGLFFDNFTVPVVQVSIDPSSVTLAASQTKQFAATLAYTSNSAVKWSISPNVGAISSSGLYTAPASITTKQTVTLTAVSVADPTASGASVITLLPPSAATAKFSRTDATTQGTWKGTYGSDGYNLISHAVSYPSYVTPVVSGQTGYTWSANTNDVRALQQTTSTLRFAGVWYTPDKMLVDLNLTDTKTHELAVYCLDWDNAGRIETLEILDSNQTVLDTRTVSGFASGIWIVWNVSGHIQLRVTRTSGMNAVVSGILFSSAAPVTLQRLDTTTQGNWKGVYGKDGYNVIGNAVSYPAYVAPSPSGSYSYTWSGSTTETRALQQAGSSTDRIAGVWYAPDQFVVDLPFNDSQTHQLAVYFLDWDKFGRTQTVEILSGTGTVLDTRTISNFGNGVWAVWNVSGLVKLRVTRTGALNAVLTGLFFDPTN